MPGRYFTIKETAERLAVSHDTVSRLIERGQLPAIRISERLYRIPAPALERYEIGTSATVRRVVRRQVAEGLQFGVGEKKPVVETAAPRPRSVRREVGVKTA
jgi:excisionase family DNA binding protein